MSPTLTGAAAAASSSSADSSVSAGAVIGGVAAGIVGVAALVFAALFLIRRKRNDAPLDDDFNPHNFKHQSVILPDEGVLSRASSVNRNYAERDDRSLTGQTIAAVPPSFGGSYAGYGGDNNYYGQPYAPYQAQYGYSPGQYMNSPSTPTTPYAATPTSATPFMNNQSPYGVIFQAPGSPVTRQPSNGAAQYLNRQPSMGNMRNVSEPTTPDAALTRQASMGAVSVLSRQPSVGAEQALNRQPSMGAMLSRQPTDIAKASLYRQPSDLVTDILNRQRSGQQQGEQRVGPDAHYVDLSRSSVTPFQEQQYTEISRSLNIAPPGAQTYPDEKAGARPPPAPKEDVASPFADPEDDEQELTIPGHPHVIEFPMTPQTGESFGTLPSPGRYAAAPPTPKYEATLQSPAYGIDRVPSTPPILPEIYLQERAFSPVSDTNYPNAPVSAQPSESFDLPSPLPQAHFGDGAKPGSPTAARPPSPGKLAPTSAARAEVSGVKRPDTVYSIAPEDAYDGI
ncbi:uncharacterized protein B0H18DRAFT_953178 [Fomitopsis serialis]|uniref:uncharacterized protein n=1 Tax=Fomitopsis serialis TaxID=139415 RepID=UPI002008C697|nr:uncharacterized protein B0H18DRAFT_953178 [Neoantrodia serialis]KAH9930242.1 hypothetical protein B0H18DRAFT_953178 [Neoantrodia serialis]